MVSAKFVLCRPIGRQPFHLRSRHPTYPPWFPMQVTFYEDNSQAKEVGPGRHIAAHKSDILDMATQNVPDGGAAPMLATVRPEALRWQPFNLCCIHARMFERVSVAAMVNITPILALIGRAQDTVDGDHPSLLLACGNTARSQPSVRFAMLLPLPPRPQVSDDGEVCVWNVESGACRKRLLPPGQDQVAPNERPVEAVRFMNPPLQAVFLTVRPGTTERCGKESRGCLVS